MSDDEKAPEIRKKTWVFTWNNPRVLDLPFLKQLFDQLAAKYVFQLEAGEQGTPHVQGVVAFRSARTFSAVRNLHPQVDTDRWHWEVCRNWRLSALYCQKEEGRLDGPWTGGDVPRPKKRVRDWWDPELASQWQRDLLSVLSGPPDPRKVYWLWEATGGTGKSTFARHLVGFNERFRGRSIVLSGKFSDVSYAVVNHVLGDPERSGRGSAEQTDTGSDLDLVIFDLERAAGNHVSYKAIENLKNGMIFAPKYKSRMALFEKCHVVVFSNEPPDESKMSRDRWEVWHIAVPRDAPPSPRSNEQEFNDWLAPTPPDM